MKARCCWTLLIQVLVRVGILLFASILILRASGATADTSPSTTAEIAMDGQLKDPPAANEGPPASSDDATIIQAYEQLNKWKECLDDDSPKAQQLVRHVYQHNRSRAAATGFPTRLTVGQQLGLSDHQTAAIFGWTTGDYRFLNPIARGQSTVECQDYPFVPQELTQLRFRLKAADVQPYVSILNAALLKLPPLSLDGSRFWRGHARRLESTIVGSLIVLPGFSSVTRDRDTAISFATNPDSSSNQRTVVCILDQFSARQVSKLSARSCEYEVLFPLNRTFQVVDAPEDDSRDKDRHAVEAASRTLKQTNSAFEIELVYLKEVGRPSYTDGR